jgi:lysophospholipase L1-like esterase
MDQIQHMSVSMVRKIALNFTALFVGVIVSLIFLEIALRIYNPIVETIKGGRVVLQVNFEQIRRNTRIPGVQSTQIPGVAPEVHIHQNSLGFRGADPPADFASRLTMVTVGGSTTRSAAQADDRTWTALLGDAVANCFDRTWINNAGFEGHTSFAHVDLIRTYLSKLHPKVVLLLIGANELLVDFLNAHDREAAPANASGHEATVRWQEYEADIEGRVEGLEGRTHVGIRHFLNALSTQSEVVDLALTLYRSYRAWKGGLNSGNLQEGEPMPEDAAARLAVARDAQPQYAERLRLIIRLLRDAQTIPVLMTQPTIGGAGRDPTTGMDLSRLWYGQSFQQSFEIYNETMRQVAQSENVYLIDLEHEMPKDTKYYLDPIHFSDAGATKVGDLVTTGLLPYLGEKFPSFNKGSCQIPSGNPG